VSGVTGRRDILAGAALIALALAMIWEARGFPSIRAMAYGPDLFPNIIAGGLILSALGIYLEAFRGAAPSPDDEGLDRRGVLAFGGIVLLVAGFAILLPILGFHVAAALTLLISTMIFGGSWIVAAMVAVSGSIVLHYIFYSFLRVVLPWGLLAPVAW
tara:strand:+ start:2266 stop:2739 length:474 start_codon:yes stop_codon:yes gene_type:complete